MIDSRPRARLVACAIALLTTAAAAAERPAGLPEDAVAVLSPDGRSLEALRGLRVPVGVGAAGAERTRAWLREAFPAFGLAPGTDDVVIDRVEDLARGRTRVTLRQHWRGIPVSGADARAVLSAAGELIALGSTLAPVAPDAEEPQLARERAIALAARATGADLTRVPARARLVIRRTDRADRLAWEVSLEPAGRGPARVWVAARGASDVLDVDAGIARAVGLVYPTDPRGAFAEVELPRLAPAEGLASATLVIEDQAGPKVLPIAPGDYRHPPETPGFDQVNAYWHADRFLHDFLGALGYAGPPEPLVVRVHSPLEPNVGLTSGRFVHLGRAIPGFTHEASRSHDIIYHEIVHAVLYGKDVSPGGVRREAGALHEALSDYLTAAFTGDPALCEWAYLAFPSGATRVDMPADPWNMTYYDQVAYGAAPATSVWANSMILSSTLWELRGVIGPACDSLVLEAMDFLPSVPAFAHMANALLEADAEFHGGRFAEHITALLLRRGIRGAAVADFSGPTQLPPGQVGEFVAVPCCGGVLGRYTWRAQPICRGTTCGEVRELGEGRTLQVSFRDEVWLMLRVETPWGDTLHQQRRIALRSPSLDLSGPTRVTLHSRGTWTARAVASVPHTITWERQWAGPRAEFEPLGTGSEKSFAVETSCVLRVTLRDGQGRTVQRLLGVQTFADRPPPAVTGVFQASLALLDGARRAEVRYELVRDATLKLEVVDVTGRLRARLADAPAGRGAHVVGFDIAGLEPGIYLLRVRHGEDGKVLRFIVLR